MPTLVTPGTRTTVSLIRRPPFSLLAVGALSGNSANASAVGTCPPNIKNGDLLIVVINSGNVTVSDVPSGWTLAHERLSGAFSRIYWKLANNEPSTWTWTLSGSTAWQVAVLVYEGDPNISVDEVSDAASVGGTTVTLAQHTADTPTTLLIATAGQGGGRAFVGPASMNTVVNTTGSPGNNSQIVCSQYISDSGVTGSRVITGTSLACPGVMVSFKR